MGSCKRRLFHLLAQIVGLNLILAGVLMPVGSVLGQVVGQQQAAVAQPRGKQTLHGHVPSITARLQPVGRLAPLTRLGIIIGLPLRGKQEADTLFKQIYDPGSSDYHQYLTPVQFTARFGPTKEDYQALTDFVEANGMTVTGTQPNRTLLDVSGTVAQIEKMFHVSLLIYQHPTEPRTFFAPDVDPSLDSVVPVLHISGLDNYIRLHSNMHRKKPNPRNATPQNGSGPSGNYMGNDFRAAYVPGVSLTGFGQAVALVEFDGYYPNDIAIYEGKAGIHTVPLSNVLLDGFSGTPGSDNGEVALDIEMAISIAPGLSNVFVYEAINNDVVSVDNDILNRIATDDLANQISCSWTGLNIDASTEQIFQEFGLQGQSFFNSSGDKDAYVGGVPSPVDEPSITIVGGTSLTMSGSGEARVSESVWNDNNGTGSGGGISASYPIPEWQQGVDMSANRGSKRMRNLPDVAMVADDIFVVADNGQEEAIEGTSAGAPLWAGFMALVNQQAETNGMPPVGFINPAIYGIGQSTNYGSCFNDITSGNNTSSASPNQFFAVSGYDLCTGWGTPSGTDLINALTYLMVIDLGTLGGSISEALAINNMGQVVGDAYASGDLADYAYLYSEGAMINLGTLGGDDDGSMACAINNKGQVVGFSWNCVSNRAFLYNAARMTDLGTLGGAYSQASGINNSGQVVGYANTVAGPWHAFLYSAGTMSDLGTLDSDTNAESEATAINDNGLIACINYYPGTDEAYLYNMGAMTYLGTLGGSYSDAYSINDSNQVVGFSTISGNDFGYASLLGHAFLYCAGTMTDLGTLGTNGSEATSINNKGQIVGFTYDYNTGGEGCACLYAGGRFIDLNTWIDQTSGWTLLCANGINDKGQIVGYGLNPLGQRHAFLLTRYIPAVATKLPMLVVTSSRTDSELTLAWSGTRGQTWQLQVQDRSFSGKLD